MNRRVMAVGLAALRTEARAVYPTISDNPQRQAWYVAMRDSGLTHRGAEMLALQQAPRANTDREFTQGHNHGGWLNEVGPIRRKRLLAAAQKLGINPNARIYKSGLGPPSDPRAWVEGKADIVRVCQEKKLICESDDSGLTYEPEATAPKKSVPLAADIVNRLVTEKLAREPGLAEKVKRKPNAIREVQAAVIDKHAHKTKRKLIKG